MSWPDIFLLCFAIGVVWSLATLLLGALHLGHGSGGHGHAVHLHSGHGHGHVHGPAHLNGHGQQAGHGAPSWLAAMINPSSLAAFLAWFGGIGYIVTRHTGWQFWADMTMALVAGTAGAWLLGAFLAFLQSREQPLDPADYELVGVLGQVSSPIRPDGVGELIYVRDGARRLLAARSEEGRPIRRGEEVIVTRYERGIAYVRTWAAMVDTQPGVLNSAGAPSQRETNHVE